MRTHRLSPRAATSGLTLIEVVVSMGIVGVAVLGIFALITSVQAGNRTSDAVNVATTLANDKLEQLKAQHVLWEQFSNDVAKDVAAGSDQVGVNGRTYTRSWSLNPDDPLTGMKNIVMLVSWGQGKLRVDTALAYKQGGNFNTCTGP